MLSKITFSAVLLSTVLVLTSFYGNDREEQEEYVTYTLFIENLKSQNQPFKKDEIVLTFDGEVEVGFKIKTDKNVRVEGKAWNQKNKTVFEGSIEKGEKLYAKELLPHKLKIIGKNYTIKSIELTITTPPTLRESEVKLSGGIHVKDKIKGKFSQLVANDVLSMCREVKPGLWNLRDNSLQFTLGDKSSNNDESCLSFLCSKSDDVPFSMSDNDISSLSREEIDETGKDKASKPILNSLSFKLNRPTPVKEEVTPEEKPTTGLEESGEPTATIPTTPEVEEQAPKFPKIENINFDLDLAVLNSIQEDTTIIVPIKSANACTPPCTIKITNNVDIKGKAVPNADATEIEYTYTKETMDLLNAENRRKEEIKFKLIDSEGVESQGEGSLIITFKQAPKNISEGINPIPLNDTILMPISNYNSNDSILSNRHIEVEQQIGEEDLLIILVSAFPIDTAHINGLVNKEAQNLSRYNNEILHTKVLSNLKAEDGRSLSQYASGKNYYDVEDFTLKIFDNKAEATAYRKGKNLKSTFDTAHHSLPTTPKNTAGERGHYAFSTFKPREMCQRRQVENIDIYLTFENNNLYTPVKIYAYTIALKSETI